jgi:fatty-acid desaturase
MVPGENCKQGEAAMEMTSTERVIAIGGTSPVHGKVHWLPVKSLWITGMTLAALIGGPLTFSWGAFAVFMILCAVTICAGHSVGMHRLLIHRSFKTHIWIEHFLVYLGVLVGMAGPHGMIRLHDFRDWGQRQTACHDFFAHRAGFWRDAWWQLHCAIALDQPPLFKFEPHIERDRFYRLVEHTWMLQQLPLALILYALGGLGFVIWGICCRVSISLIGHWLVGYFAHQPKAQVLRIEGGCVQGYNLPKLGIVTFGEAFHENHHAFPGSARLGIMPGQVDPGWFLVRALEALGLAREINTPDNMKFREGLVLANNSAVSGRVADGAWISRVPILGS